MKIFLNGNEKYVDGEENILHLLTQSKINHTQAGVAVALNDDVLSKEDWNQIRLKENDRVEIIHAVQGG